MKLVVFAVSVMLCMPAVAQQGIGVGAAVGDFPIQKLINHPKASATFKELQAKLTIVDFFGTWCIPCIRALPRLKEIQQQYANEVKVLLVSTEEEPKLQQFIGKQRNFSLPIAVDADNAISNLFQPPAYPYTLVISGSGKLVAITDVEHISDSQIRQWLSQEEGALPQAESISKTPQPKMSTSIQKSTNSAVQLSQEFMYAARTGDEQADALSARLQELDYAELRRLLDTDAEKKAFWINVYNGYVQRLLRRNPDQYRSRNSFFKSKQLPIAGKTFSLDGIEHGILRRSRIKWSLGYLGKLFPGSTEKELRVDTIDYRIHFALNCGAKSCPPIAYYRPESLDTQLDLATKAYLSSEVVYDTAANRVQVPAILSWFRGDFGGKQGIRSLLEKTGVVPEGKKPKIKFKEYDWTLYLDNYKIDNQ